MEKQTRELLKVSNLKTSFATKDGEVQAVRGISFAVNKGEILGIVGESGSGKSVTSLSILQVLPDNAFHKEGSILFSGQELTTMSKKEFRKIRGAKISMIFQDPMTCLNPLMKVGHQIQEAILQHNAIPKQQAKQRVLQLLEKVHIPDPAARYNAYPHELSGGMRQRAMIAMALSCQPELLIADEPTTALDVTIQDQILMLLKEMRNELNISVIFITHDLGVVAELCDRVAVMYGGLILEQGPTDEIFSSPQHPYTLGLMASIPMLDQDKTSKLRPIEGSPPDMAGPPSGCPFYPRCEYARMQCTIAQPEFFATSQQHSSACWLLHPNAPQTGNPFAETAI